MSYLRAKNDLKEAVSMTTDLIWDSRPGHTDYGSVFLFSNNPFLGSQSTFYCNSPTFKKLSRSLIPPNRLALQNFPPRILQHFKNLRPEFTNTSNKSAENLPTLQKTQPTTV